MEPEFSPVVSTSSSSSSSATTGRYARSASSTRSAARRHHHLRPENCRKYAGSGLMVAISRWHRSARLPARLHVVRSRQHRSTAIVVLMGPTSAVTVERYGRAARTHRSGEGTATRVSRASAATTRPKDGRAHPSITRRFSTHLSQVVETVRRRLLQDLDARGSRTPCGRTRSDAGVDDNFAHMTHATR